MRDNFSTPGAFNAQPIRPSRFAHDMEQMLGDDLDLDPLFLEESWTAGAPAALENLRRRRQSNVDREQQSRAAREFDNLRLIASVEQSAGELLESWTPFDWTPQAQSAQSWIPQGWMPARIALVPEQLAGEEPAAENPDRGMTLARAQQILGVTASSSREQIRSVYRRMVGQCHPDRLAGASDAVRQLATQQMASVNEAYRLLCAAQLEEAA